MVLLAVAICLASVGAARATTSGNADLRGVWTISGRYAQSTTITQEDLSTGVFSGRGVAHNNTGYTWPSHGVVHGSTVVTWVFGPYDQLKKYTATCKGTVSPDGKTVTGECADTYGRPFAPGWVMTRAVGPTKSPGAPAVCVGGCDSTQVSYDPTLDPGQATEVMEVGCGGVRATSGVSRSAGGGCGVDGTVVQKQADIEARIRASVQDILHEADRLSNQAATHDDPALKSLIDTLQQAQQLQEDQSQLEQIETLQRQMNQLLKDTFLDIHAVDIQDVDQALAADFPADSGASADRVTSSARARARTVNPLLVFQSITAAHPSAAAAKAYTAEVELATGPTYSSARAEARLTLAAALVLGTHVLAIELKGRQIVVVHGAASVKAPGKRRLTLTATPAGARVLRLLGIAGLGHRVTLPLRLSSTYRGRTARSTRQLTVR
jgi:hypothetical protein